MPSEVVMEDLLMDKYFDSRLKIPGPLVQFFLNTYLEVSNRYEKVFGRQADPGLNGSQGIAELSEELMRTHYDMPLALFENFLDRSLKYSMGLWEHGARDVDEAQQHMLADVCRKAQVEDGQRVLDIGCGFGSLADYVLRTYPNTRVYGLTLSQTQADYIRAKQEEPGHPFNTDRFSLIQDDFNRVAFTRDFDRVVSLGVFEHVTNLGKALEKVRSILSPRGKTFHHYIVYRPYPKEPQTPRQNSVIERYIFPGGRIWSENELHNHQDDLTIEQSWFLSGHNYRRTLEAWLGNLLRNREAILWDPSMDQRRLKIWEFYLRACIAVFRTAGGRYYGNAQYLLAPR